MLNDICLNTEVTLATATCIIQADNLLRVVQPMHGIAVYLLAGGPGSACSAPPWLCQC